MDRRIRQLDTSRARRRRRDTSANGAANTTKNAANPKVRPAKGRANTEIGVPRERRGGPVKSSWKLVDLEILGIGSGVA
jgi:hypothetical protein